MLRNIRNKNTYSLGMGISTVLKKISYFNFLGGGVDPMGHDVYKHWILLNTRNKNINGLGVGISTIFEIFSYFSFLGGGVHPRGHDLHTSGCSLIQGTRIYRV
jgi:hypothetical protein